MQGVGPDGRRYLLARPPPDEVEDTLWRMVCEARRREDSLRQELRDRNEQ